MSLVSFVKIRGDNFKEAIASALRFIDYTFPADAHQIVIKPNLCYYWDYSTGHTTDSRFVESLINILRERYNDPEIVVVESDASAMRCVHAFRILGYEKLSRRSGIRLVNLSEEDYDNVETTVLGEKLSFHVPKIIMNADLRLNIPKPKPTIPIVGVTCALKNIYGCNPYPRKSKYHKHLNRTIVALNKLMNFDLCIVDGNVVVGEYTRKLGLIMASRDPVAIDSAVASISGVTLAKNNHVRLANLEGLGTLDFVSKGMDPTYFTQRFPTKDANTKVREGIISLIQKIGLSSALNLR